MAAKAVQITNVLVLHERAAALVVLSDNKEITLQNSLKNPIMRQRKTGEEKIVKYATLKRFRVACVRSLFAYFTQPDDGFLKQVETCHKLHSKIPQNVFGIVFTSHFSLYTLQQNISC
jgi:hypothetical protein